MRPRPHLEVLILGAMVPLLVLGARVSRPRACRIAPGLTPRWPSATLALLRKFSYS